MNAFCPNCGKRYLGMGDDFLDGDSGCGDCAQAGVRPRDSYKLRLFTPWSDDTALAAADGVSPPPPQSGEMRAVPMEADLRERYLTDATFHAEAYVAAEAMHRASGFDPDWTGWPCDACLSRACVALDAVERASGPLPPQPRDENTTDDDLIGQFDAQVWAAEFVRRNVNRSDIVTDEAAMRTWFSAAIMSGYDYALKHRPLDALRETVQAIIEELAPKEKLRGYCGTPYCGGWTAKVKWHWDALMVSYGCACGSEDGWDTFGEFLKECRTIRESDEEERAKIEEAL